MEKEIYLHLDFNGKLDPSTFTRKDLCFKIVNLHKKNPLVLIDNYIFEGKSCISAEHNSKAKYFYAGKYEDCLGTNIYFEEVQANADKQEDNPFNFQAPVSLNYLVKSNKILSLQLCKLPDILHVSEGENVNLRFNHDYKTVLKKMKERCLNIEDIIEPTESIDFNNELQALKSVIQNPETQETKAQMQIVVQESSLEKQDIPEKSLDDLQALKKIIKEPMRTKQEFDVVETGTYPRTESYNYTFLKQLYLQSINYKDISLNIDESKLHLYVDIENSMKNGVINKSNFQKMTDDEKNRLISLENIENLSVPLQYTLLVNQLKEEKAVLQRMSSEELQQRDEYGRTPKERYRILKYLAKDLWYHIFCNYKEKKS